MGHQERSRVDRRIHRLHLLMKPPICPYCDKPSKLVDSKVIYGKSYGMVYHCRPCDAYVGVHRGTVNPVGTLANSELRDWRKRAHAMFDPFWQKPLQDEIAQNAGVTPKGIKSRHRGKAYRALSESMDLSIHHCHIGMFTVEQCREVVRICHEWSENRA